MGKCLCGTYNFNRNKKCTGCETIDWRNLGKVDDVLQRVEAAAAAVAADEETSFILNLYDTLNAKANKLEKLKDRKGIILEELNDRHDFLRDEKKLRRQLDDLSKRLPHASLPPLADLLKHPDV